MTFRLCVFLSAAILPLAACGTAERAVVTGTAGSVGGTPAAACVDAVETNGGRGATVLGATPSADGAAVLIRSSDGIAWNCTATSRGVVTELSVA